ncbi:MAG: acyltransferase [Patescibacteria group bacterium]
MKRLIFLDELRGLAILCIMLFHYLYLYDLRYGHLYTFSFNFHWGGFFGIYLFFVISGFVVMKSLERVKKPLDFIINRLSKLYPSYWLAMIITYTFVFIFGLPGREVGFKDFLINLSMLQHWLGVPDVDGVYWILPIFLIFYGFIVLTLLTKQLKHIEIIGVGWLIIEVGLRLINFPYRELIRSFFGFFDYAHLFLIGILFYQLKTKGFIWWRNLLIWLVFLIELSNHKTTETISLLVILTIFYLIIINKLQIMENRLFKWLGQISYPLFLVHTNIGYVVIQKVYTFSDSPLLILGLPFLITLLLATAIYYWIEKPALTTIRNIYYK